MVDVQKTRLETRTRKDEAGQDVEYTVEVPYKEQMEVEYVVCLPPEGYRADKPFDQVGVYNLRGEMLDRDEAANRLLKAQQVFAIECKPGMNTIVLDPFYAQLLPPDMLVLYCKNLAETVPAPPKAVPPKPVPTAKK